MKEFLIIEYAEKDVAKEHPSYRLFNTLEKVHKEYGSEGWESFEDPKAFPCKGLTKKRGYYVTYWGETFYTVDTIVLFEVEQHDED